MFFGSKIEVWMNDTDGPMPQVVVAFLVGFLFVRKTIVVKEFGAW